MANPPIFVPLVADRPGEDPPACGWVEMDATLTIGPDDVESYVWNDDGYLSMGTLIAPDYDDGFWSIDLHPATLSFLVYLASPGPYGSDAVTLKVYSNIPWEYGFSDGHVLGHVELDPLDNEVWVEVEVPLDWQQAFPGEGVGKITVDSFLYSGSPTLYIAPICPDPI